MKVLGAGELATPAESASFQFGKRALSQGSKAEGAIKEDTQRSALASKYMR